MAARLSRRRMEYMLGMRQVATLIPRDYSLGRAIWEIVSFSAVYYLIDVVALRFVGPWKGRALGAYLLVCWLLRLLDPGRRKILDPVWTTLMAVYPHLHEPGGLNLAFSAAGFMQIVLPRIVSYYWDADAIGDTPYLIWRDVAAATTMAGVPWLVSASNTALDILFSLEAPPIRFRFRFRFDTRLPQLPSVVPQLPDFALPNTNLNLSWRSFAVPIAIFLLGFAGSLGLATAARLFQRFLRSIWIYHLPRRSRAFKLMVSRTNQDIELLLHRAASFFWTVRLEPLEHPPLCKARREIRLLEIEPREQKGRIKCKFVVVPLDSKPHFEAISHRWDVRGPTRIRVDGQRMTVSTSVYRILRNLQPAPPTREPRRVWIDSICIKQTEKLEKDWQIDLMTDIYTTAHQVVGWMGESPSSRGALSYVSAMHKVAHSNDSDLIQQHFVEWFVNGEYHPRWHAVRSLLGQAFFSRVWIVQEVALARKLILRHGYDGERLSWETLSEFSRLFLRPDFEPCLRDALRVGAIGAGMDPRLYLNIINIKTMNMLREERHASDHGIDINTVLSEALAFDAQELKDRVIGLKGLTDEDTREAIRALKDEPVQDILRKVAEQELLRGNLNSLHLAGGPYPGPGLGISALPGFSSRRKSESKSIAGDLNLPSWCPDWISKPMERPFFAGKGRRAGKHLTASVKMASGGRMLMRGVVFDEVLALGEVSLLPRDSTQLVATSTKTKAWKTFEEFVHAGTSLCSRAALLVVYPGESAATLFWRTVFTDRLGEDTAPPAPEGGIKAADEIFKSTLLAMRNPRMVPTGKEGRDWAERLVQGQQALLMAVGANTTGKKLCLTKQRYVGLVPAATRPHDWICLISGAPTPFVVRPVDGSRQVASGKPNRFIGSCYVQGITDGELEGAMAGYSEDDLLFE